jgi:hypothetical protein
MRHLGRFAIMSLVLFSAALARPEDSSLSVVLANDNHPPAGEVAAYSSSAQHDHSMEMGGLVLGITVLPGATPTPLLQKTGNIAAVMNSMGHSDVRTAMTYQHPELNVVRDAINSRHVLRHTTETVN